MTASPNNFRSQPVQAPPYGAYGQLVRMLLPSSGCVAIHAPNGDLAWCSDGYERPDFRSLIEESAREPGALANQGQLRKTVGGVGAIVTRLADPGGAVLGFMLVELRGAATAASGSMAVSLLRPLFTALAAQLAVERAAAVGAKAPDVAGASDAAEARPGDARLDFLLGAGEIDFASPRAVQELLQRCVDRLDCLAAALCIPDQELTEVAERAAPTDPETRARLEATRRHLLAWAQLNNRPMVVNRIDQAKSPYKILSAPIPARDGKSGLLALFRSADSPNFELDDVRLIEFIGRLAIALLNERRDRLTGLMNRSSFERYLDGAREAAASGDTGMLLCFDIVALREINANFGFRVGDEAILRSAQLIRRALALGEVACRLAGDSFGVHLPKRDAAAAEELGKKIAAAAAELGFTTQGSRVPLSLRFGLAALTGEARHGIAAAELACRQAGASRGQPSL